MSADLTESNQCEWWQKRKIYVAHQFLEPNKKRETKDKTQSFAGLEKRPDKRMRKSMW